MLEASNHQLMLCNHADMVSDYSAASVFLITAIKSIALYDLCCKFEIKLNLVTELRGYLYHVASLLATLLMFGRLPV